jgi:hypothetical protein
VTPCACTYIPKDKRKKLEAAASAKRGARTPAASQRSLSLTAVFAGRDEGEDAAAPSKKHAEDGKPVEEDEADNEGEPNKILFVQNLPEAAPPAAITAALKQVLASSCLPSALLLSCIFCVTALNLLTLRFSSSFRDSAAFPT